MAAFCLVTGQPPSTYYELSRVEIAAFLRIANRRT